MSYNKENKGVIYPDLSYKIVGCAFEVYNELGAGFPEKYYQKALAVELKLKQIAFREQVYFPLKFKSELIGKNYFDFLIEDNVVVELKRGNHFSKSHFDQILRYLKASDKKLGLLINFATEGVQVKRVLNLY